MMIDGEELIVAELPEGMRKWIRDEFEEMKTSSYHVMEMMKRRQIEIPMETTKRKRKDEWNGYIGK